jgi:hypothetical protein
MVKIRVDCEKNDRHNIKCGGPETLGYTFYVPSNEEKYIELIKSELKKNNQPLISISHKMVKYNTKLSSEKDIIERIRKGYG